MKNYRTIKELLASGYRVMSNGDILGKRGWMLKPCVTRGGYKVVHLHLNGKSYPLTVHSIVWVAFHGTSVNNINHIDGNKLNNKPENLEESDSYKQMRHAYSIGLMRDQRGDNIHKTKVSRKDVLSIRKRIYHGEQQKHLAKEFGISKAQVSRIANNLCWSNI